MIQWMLAILISSSSAFSKSSLYIWKFSVHVLLKPSLKDFEHYLASMWNRCNCTCICFIFLINLMLLFLYNVFLISCDSYLLKVCFVWYKYGYFLLSWLPYAWNVLVHVLLKPGLENFKHHFTSLWDEYSCALSNV